VKKTTKCNQFASYRQFSHSENTNIFKDQRSRLNVTKIYPLLEFTPTQIHTKLHQLLSGSFFNQSINTDLYSAIRRRRIRGAYWPRL